MALRSPGARPRRAPRSPHRPSWGARQEDAPEDRWTTKGRVAQDAFRETIWEEDDPIILNTASASSTASSDASSATRASLLDAPFHQYDLKLAPAGSWPDLGGLPSCPHPRRARRPPPLDLDDADVDTETTSTPSESTVALEVPDAPFVHKHTVDDVTATITWSGPEAKQRVSFYQVTLRVLETPDGLGAVDAPDPWVFNQVAGSTIKLTDLQPSTKYCLGVRAANTAGAGEWCPPYKFATLAGAEKGFGTSPVRVTVRRARETPRRTVHFGGGEEEEPRWQPPELEDGWHLPRESPRWCPRPPSGTTH
ncbi:fibronectin type III domain-containing protein 8 [Tachyglossus aculeatus]|uniref:fibronectin type III domain-containing protein 8 n=1 Tax=Tachyglossus aculeatus TaxID=9261 RepID=UPI0018F437FF|nr:fibronectin type III domain-containing protein 8 [Tachyglossus aculeatus]